MIDNPFRKWLAQRARLILLTCQTIGVTPNIVTLGSLFFAIVASFTCSFGFDLLSILLWWFSRLLDSADGILARHTGNSTVFGAYLDILCDMASYSFMVIAMSFRFPNMAPAWLAVLCLYVLCITSALGLGSLQNDLKIPPDDNRGLRLGAGLIEGGETGIAYTVFLLFPHWIHIWVPMWVALLVVTVLFRTLLAYKIFKVHS